MKFLVSIVSILGAVLLASGAVRGEEPEADATLPEALQLDDFQVIQYVGTRGFSPEAVMRLDSNDEILIACREPLTREELRARGVSFIESQLVLLNAMGMLSLSDGQLETVLPFLGAEPSARVRAVTRAAAAEIAESLAPELSALRQAIEEQGAGSHAHGIFFSYVLDGMVWDFFEEYGEVRPRRLSVAQPHWAGLIWGMYPPRDSAIGTSTVASGGLTLRIGHSKRAGEALAPLLSDWRSLRQWLEQLAAEEPAVDAALATRLAKFGVATEAGEVAVPVVHEVPGDGIFEAAQRLTEKLVERVRALPFEDLAAEVGLRSRQQMLIVVYHELMWDLLEELERSGLIQRPKVLREPKQSTAADLAGVVFVVERPVDEVPERRDAVENGNDEE